MRLIFLALAYVPGSCGRRVHRVDDDATKTHSLVEVEASQARWRDQDRSLQVLESILLASSPSIGRHFKPMSLRSRTHLPTAVMEKMTTKPREMKPQAAEIAEAAKALEKTLLASNFKDPEARPTHSEAVAHEAMESSLVQHTEIGSSTLDEEAIREETERGSRVEGQMLMLLTAILWGSNFPAVKATMDAGLTPAAAAALRFSIAAVALLPLLKVEKTLPPNLVKGGLECGVWLAIGYISQALALQDLPAGAVAFICALQVVLVPIINTLNGAAFTPRLILAASLALGGVGLLEFGSIGSVDAASVAPSLSATLLAFLQPIGFGISYLRIEKFMREYPDNGLQLSSLQLISNAAIAVSWCIFMSFGDGGLSSDIAALQQLPVVGGLMYTGLISTALTVLLQTRALGKIPASSASVITSTEAFWASLLAAVLFGEVLDTNCKIGGAMILLGCLANTMLPEDLVGGRSLPPQARERHH